MSFYGSRAPSLVAAGGETFSGLLARRHTHTERERERERETHKHTHITCGDGRGCAASGCF